MTQNYNKLLISQLYFNNYLSRKKWRSQEKVNGDEGAAWDLLIELPGEGKYWQAKFAFQIEKKLLVSAKTFFAAEKIVLADTNNLYQFKIGLFHDLASAGWAVTVGSNHDIQAVEGNIAAPAGQVTYSTLPSSAITGAFCRAEPKRGRW